MGDGGAGAGGARSGRPQEALALLERAIAEDPLRERPRELRMLALYATGRLSEALESFQAYRRLLAEDLGLDPSPSLADLQERMLRHDPSLPSAGALPGPNGSGPGRSLGDEGPQPPPPAPTPPHPGRGRREFVLAAGGVLLVGGVVAALVATLGRGTITGRSLPSPSTRAAARAVGVTGGGLLRIDPKANRVVGKPIVLGRGGGPVALGDGSLWVADDVDRALRRVDPATGETLKTQSLGGDPRVVAVGGGTPFVWAVTTGDLWVLDPSNDSPKTTLPFPADAIGLAVVTGNGNVWATVTIPSSGQTKLLRICPGTLFVCEGESNRPNDAFTIDAGGGRAVLVEGGSVWVLGDDLVRMDASSKRIVATVDAHGQFLVSAGRDTLWVLSQAGELVRIDRGRDVVAGRFRLPGGNSGMAIGEGGLWVINSIRDTVTRIDPRSGTVVGSIPIDGTPVGIAAGGGSVWVSVEGR